MEQQPWHTHDWFTSPWNFLPEVTEGLKFPEKIKIHDVTLRDGEQQAGVIFTKDDKVRIANMLAEAGVHRIEAGMPAVSPADAEAIETIADMGLPCELFVLSRCMKADVERAANSGATGVIMEIPSSEHIIEHAYKWTVEKAIELCIEATQYAKSQGLYTTFFPIDASRAEMTWYLQLIERIATEGHMDALCLVDTFGVLSPDAVRYFARRTKEHIKKPLETHFHMDYGLGVINTIVALTNGADTAHCTITGIGERAGNAPTEDLVMALLTLYGVDVGIKTEKLYELSQEVRRLANHSVPSNRQVVGDNLFAIESGIVTSWFKNAGDEHLTEVFPFRPELVGQPEPRVVLGKGSGIDSIAIWLDKIEVKATDDEMMEMLTEVKAYSLEKKALLDENEFRRIADSVVSKKG